MLEDRLPKLPMEVRRRHAVAQAECEFLNGRHQQAAEGLGRLMRLCPKAYCTNNLPLAYRLARGWLWMEPLLELARTELGSSSLKKAGNKRADDYRNALRALVVKADRLHEILRKGLRSLEKRAGRTGFLVVAVSPGTGGEQAGLIPGDVIVSVAGKALRTLKDLGAMDTADARRHVAPSPRADIIYFLRSGLGHERSLGSGRLGAEVIPIRPTPTVR